MSGRARAEIEPTLGEQAIAKTVAELPRPIYEVDDGFDGEGQESAVAMARAQIYRLLTGRSFHELYRHFESFPTVSALFFRLPA